jgi:23S rRNA (uracil1939-C5)-methyltransferase
MKKRLSPQGSKAEQAAPARNPSPCHPPSGSGETVATAEAELPLPEEEGWGEGLSHSFVTTIDAMGGQGHGVARVDGAKTFVPFTLPGERVRIRLSGGKAGAVSIEDASPDRREPICRHFGACGGCALQHWDGETYARWKTGLVTSALAREGLEAPVEALRSYPLSSRRRAVFTARKDKGEARLGFNAARSHDLVDLAECPILAPQIASALPSLREALGAALPGESEAKVHVTAAENGLDCAIEGPDQAASRRAAFIQMLEAIPIARVVWNGDIVIQKAAPFVLAGGVKVALPAGAFLQAVEACERDMADFTTSALKEARAERGPVCDLFAGLGAFTFPCAKSAPVTAYEGNAEAVAALNAAAKAASGIKPVKAAPRDLFRNPLGPFELNAFAAAIADPPREGAEAQAHALAASKIGAAIMLSCNPTTFARDAAILAGGGFKLVRLSAFDQFRFSAHVEIAALFLRPGGKKGRLSPALKR